MRARSFRLILELRGHECVVSSHYVTFRALLSIVLVFRSILFHHTPSRYKRRGDVEYRVAAAGGGTVP